ncbi:hypothetical protein Tco_0203844, partial [Tanacetum coccineum]
PSGCGGADSSFQEVQTRPSAKSGGLIVISSQRVINTPMISIGQRTSYSPAGSTNDNVPRQLLEPSKPEPRIPNIVPAIMNSTSYPIIIWPRVTGAVTRATAGPPVKGDSQRWPTTVNDGGHRQSTVAHHRSTTAGPPINGG